MTLKTLTIIMKFFTNTKKSQSPPENGDTYEENENVAGHATLKHTNGWIEHKPKARPTSNCTGGIIITIFNFTIIITNIVIDHRHQGAFDPETGSVRYICRLHCGASLASAKVFIRICSLVDMI